MLFNLYYVRSSSPLGLADRGRPLSLRPDAALQDLRSYSARAGALARQAPLRPAHNLQHTASFALAFGVTHAEATPRPFNCGLNQPALEIGMRNTAVPGRPAGPPGPWRRSLLGKDRQAF